MHGDSGAGLQRGPQQADHREGRPQPLAGHPAVQRPVAEEGGLGWPQDQTSAAHEELRQPALHFSRLTARPDPARPGSRCVCEKCVFVFV